MTSYTMIDNADELNAFCKTLDERYKAGELAEFAMDFEEESNLHIYGEHLCLIQIYDGKSYFIVDAWKLGKDPLSIKALSELFGSPIQKIMFGCSSDASICRKSLGIELKNVYDVRIPAVELGYAGGLSSMVSVLLGVNDTSERVKHKFQRANWMVRPLKEEQIEYALSDVAYLFDLKRVLEEKLQHESSAMRSRVRGEIKHCTEPKHRDREGWEKIPGYKMLSRNERVYLKHFFKARDSIARARNVPAANILDKALLKEMAQRGTWRGILEGFSLRFRDEFEEACKKAHKEIADYNGAKNELKECASFNNTDGTE